MNIGDMARPLLTEPFLFTERSKDDTSVLPVTGSDKMSRLIAGDFGLDPDCVSFSMDQTSRCCVLAIFPSRLKKKSESRHTKVRCSRKTSNRCPSAETPLRQPEHWQLSSHGSILTGPMFTGPSPRACSTGARAEPTTLYTHRAPAQCASPLLGPVHMAKKMTRKPTHVRPARPGPSAHATRRTPSLRPRRSGHWVRRGAARPGPLLSESSYGAVPRCPHWHSGRHGHVTSGLPAGAMGDSDNGPVNLCQCPSQASESRLHRD